MRFFRGMAVILAVVFCVASPSQADERETARQLLQRTVFSPDFRPKNFRGGEWFGDGDSYLALEPAASGQGTDIVRYKTATGERDMFIPASRLIPTGAKGPLDIDDYHFSPDGKQLLVFTNSQKVWRQNTRGDYWVLNLESGALRKLGGTR